MAQDLANPDCATIAKTGGGAASRPTTATARSDLTSRRIGVDPRGVHRGVTLWYRYYLSIARRARVDRAGGGSGDDVGWRRSSLPGEHARQPGPSRGGRARSRGRLGAA